MCEKCCLTLRATFLTVDGLGVVSLRVVEPIRPLLDLHPPSWADPETAPSFSPTPKNTHTVDDGERGEDGTEFIQASTGLRLSVNWQIY